MQEQIDNGDLAARLDDARNLLSDRGIDPDVRVGSRRGRDGWREFVADDDGRATRTLPAGQRAGQRRKPPFAQISGQVNSRSRRVEDDDGAARDEPRRPRSRGRSVAASAR